MLHRVASAALALSTLSLAAAIPVAAADLPQIKTGKSNQVPSCATPGRLMAFLKSRNPRLDTQFDGIATEYMRHGEALGIRWDTAFFQMLVETGNLTFKGDVKPKQNNFAGLGATGGGERGESFKDVTTGTRAHLEHVLMYAGEKIESPTAERTRKVQEWGVLTSWQKSIKGPMTFSQLTRKWSPHDRDYAENIASIAESFASGPCKGDDPRPELVEEARAGRTETTAGVDVARADGAAAKPVETDPLVKKETGAEIARRAVEEERASGTANRTGLGASSLAAAAKTAPAVTVLNAPKADAEAAPAASPAASPAAAPAATTRIEPLRVQPETQAQTPAGTSKPVAAKDTPPKDPAAKDRATVLKTAAAPQAAAKAAAAAVTAAPAVTTPSTAAAAAGATAGATAASGATCRVWQASYGGGKAVIIKAAAGADTNYTVLDVNEGAEKREAEAYIAAYAKGGQTVAEFNSPTQALDKAFELCPEG